MKVRVGIMGLPNVGKSSLFNALTTHPSSSSSLLAPTANFPFTTIDPNKSPLILPDPYLQRLSTLAKSERIVPATIQLVDVAGLVQGASRGEGLGNRFLATLRECNVLLHVIRLFEQDHIVHVHGQVNPISDAQVVQYELLLADLAHVERRLEKQMCQGEERETLEIVKVALEGGIPARECGLTRSQYVSIQSMGLLTLKPVVYACNVDEVDFTLGREDTLLQAQAFMKDLQKDNDNNDQQTGKSTATATTEDFILVSAQMEAELGTMSPLERHDYLAGLDLDVSSEFDNPVWSRHALPLLVQRILHLSTCYTGPGVPPDRSKTTRAHLFSDYTFQDKEQQQAVDHLFTNKQQKPMTAWDMAGRIHGDLKKGFIRCEVVSVSDLLQHESYSAAEEGGLIRTEGKDYVIEDGDVLLIKWKS